MTLALRLLLRDNCTGLSKGVPVGTRTKSSSSLASFLIPVRCVGEAPRSDKDAAPEARGAVDGVGVS